MYAWASATLTWPSPLLSASECLETYFFNLPLISLKININSPGVGISGPAGGGRTVVAKVLGLRHADVAVAIAASKENVLATAKYHHEHNGCLNG